MTKGKSQTECSCRLSVNTEIIWRMGALAKVEGLAGERRCCDRTWKALEATLMWKQRKKEKDDTRTFLPVIREYQIYHLVFAVKNQKTEQNIWGENKPPQNPVFRH